MIREILYSMEQIHHFFICFITFVHLKRPSQHFGVVAIEKGTLGSASITTYIDIWMLGK